VNGPLWWYVARSSGLVAWALAAASVIWGLGVSGRPLGRRVPPAWLLDLHRFLGGLALAFTGVHVGGLLLDRTVEFGLAAVLVPFASGWRPGAVAWGVVALYLLVAVEVTSLAKRRLSHRVWRRLHLLSFPMYVAATAHLLSAGTDARSILVQRTAVAATALVLFLALLRLLSPRGAAGRTGPTGRGQTGSSTSSTAATPSVGVGSPSRRR
jgi:DMSO/TMAO reductase YedYZ heme-binding membrane subunit